MSSAASLQRHTGFFDGHLKCTAIRHGWTRSFSISQDELEEIDYSSLSRILELNTLKLRSTNLRIFVENPVDSGTFTQVHYWKDDGSLQSVLVKEFFMQRLEQDAVLRFEIRDGKERTIDIVDDAASEGHGTGLFRKGSLKDSVFSMSWLSNRRALRTEGSVHTYTSGSEETGLSRFFKFLFAPRWKRANAYTQQLPSGDNDESAPLRPVETTSSEDASRPPVTERTALLAAASKKTSLRQRLLYASQNHGPFFSSGGPRRSVGHPTEARTKDTAAQYHNALGITTTSSSRTSRGPSSQPTPVEEVSMWEQESTTADEDASGREAPPGLITAFWRSFWTPRSTTPIQEPATNDQPKPAQKAKRPSKPSRRKSTRASALPPAELHFKGAHVVRRPEDAFPPRPDSAAGRVTDRRPAEDDPFHG
ncbi:hypothetical protein BKA62DRAFT_764282 [Auriculariales sp. MPI-PUGE-AT-0066]|nr:hypothetical protein BKA62DRAFT_764282 [Auriculariales sp. MPI-PUGE-AT-0066]